MHYFVKGPQNRNISIQREAWEGEKKGDIITYPKICDLHTDHSNVILNKNSNYTKKII